MRGFLNPQSDKSGINPPKKKKKNRQSLYFINLKTELP